MEEDKKSKEKLVSECGSGKRTFPKLTKEEQQILTRKLRAHGINNFFKELGDRSLIWGLGTRGNLYRIYTGRGGISPLLAKTVYEFFNQDKDLSFLPTYFRNVSEEDLRRIETSNTPRPKIGLNSAYAILYDATIGKLRENYLTLGDEKKRELVGFLEMMITDTMPKIPEEDKTNDTRNEKDNR